MLDTDKIMIKRIRSIIDDYGFGVFADTRKVCAIIADLVTDSSLSEEKVLLKRVMASGAMGFIATTNRDNYSSDRQKALYLLTEREFLAKSWAEKALGWFDEALGYVRADLKNDLDSINQLNGKDKSSSAQFISPIDMLFDDENIDNIILYNDDNQKFEFEQIAVVPIENRIYAVLKPVLEIEGVADDEALVFAIEEADGEERLVIVEDDEIIDKVFYEYYELLKAEGIDVD